MSQTAEKPVLRQKESDRYLIKTRTLAEMKANLEGATLMAMLDYRGLSVEELQTLRRLLAKEGAELLVVKNTIMRKAVADTEYALLQDLLKGPSAVLVAKGDQVMPVKALKAYLKQGKKSNAVRGGVLDAALLSSEAVDALAALPSLPELRAKLAGAIASPGRGLVNVLYSPLRSVASVLDQYKEKIAS